MSVSASSDHPLESAAAGAIRGRSAASPSAALRVALAAGLAAAVIEMAFVLPIQQYLGNSPVVVFQSIAAGALGAAAFSGGLGTAALGVAVHLLISLVAALLFVFAALRFPVLRQRAWLSAMLYGVLVYLVMTFVVVPLSAIGFRLPKSLPLWSLSFSIHLFAFALPITLVARRLLRVR